METPPILEYSGPEPRRGTHISLGWGILIIVAFTLVTLGVMLAVHSARHGHPREKACQIKCASNLRQLGMEILLYRQDNIGLNPPNLQAVLLTRDVSPVGVTCPSTDDSPGSPRPTTAQAAANLSLPNHCSYLYVGAGLTATSDPNCVVALEDPGNHALEGGNVLYADGHVNFESLPQIMQVLNDLNAGRNPPATKSTLGGSAARDDYVKRWKARMPALKTGVWQIPTARPAVHPE